jgi:hypothetical protein
MEIINGGGIMPTKLNLFERPYVVFDVKNKNHRKYFASFLSTGSWKHCPVQFLCDEEFSASLPAMMRDQMVEYYAKKEFKDLA